MNKKINMLIAIVTFANLSAIEQPKIKIPRVTPQISKKKDHSEANRKSKLERDRAKKEVEQERFQENIQTKYHLSKDVVEKACKFYMVKPLPKFPETPEEIQELSKKYDARLLYARSYALDTGRVKPFANQKAKKVDSSKSGQARAGAQ